jgi:membrane associated rhomboid family serine protease
MSLYSLIFLPMVNLPIIDGVKLMVGFDAIGAIIYLFTRRQILEHFGHLGGALAGYLYFKYGNALWEACKVEIRSIEKSLAKLRTLWRTKAAYKRMTVQ